MDSETAYNVLILVTIVSVIIAFVASSRSTRLRFGSVYEKTVNKSLLAVGATLLPIIIYSAVSALRHGWETILYSPECAIAAFLLMLTECNALGQGLAVKSSYAINPDRLSMVSGLSLLLLCTSLTLTITSFQTARISQLIAWVQVIVLILAIVFFYCFTTMVKLLRNGYVPQPHRQF